MKKRIYMAGGSTERLTVVRPLMERVRASEGLEITHDWTVFKGYDELVTLAERTNAALEDFAGIGRADIVWFLWPEALSEGIGAEFGYARALQHVHGNGPRKLVVSGPRFERCIFTGLAMLDYPTHEEAFEYIAAVGAATALEVPRAALS